MRYQQFLALSILSPIVWANSLPTDVKITIFTTQSYPIQHAELAHNIYFIDTVENLEEEATKFLSEDLNTAERQAKKWLSSAAGKEFESKLKEAYTGVTEGWKQGIMKVPAILFEQHHKDSAVIYGQTNVAKAIETYLKTEE